jgi:hypothetical protein
MLSLQHDTGRWCTEYTYSAEDSMVGVRMLHNFGKLAAPSGSAEESERSATSRGGGMKMKRIDEEDAMEGGLKGRFSAGAEIYFSAKERSAGGPLPPHRHLQFVVLSLSLLLCMHENTDVGTFRQYRRASGSLLFQMRRRRLLPCNPRPH